MFKIKKMEIITLNKNNITDFALERNKLLNNSKSDWVFFVDSDEVVSDSLKSEIINEIVDSKFDAYYVIRKNYFLGKYVGFDKILRLVKKGSGKWERSVHEVFRLSGGRTGELKNLLIHNTANNLNEYISKINIYSKLHAEANKKEGKVSTVFKIIFYPMAKFVVTYFKSKHVVFSIMQSFHSFLSWSDLWLIQNDDIKK